jgi:hypothetical protein
MPDSTPTVTVPIPAKPASQSKTLRFNNLVMWIGGLAAFVPDILSFVLSLLGDPTVASAVNDAVPMKYRAAFAAILVIIGQRNKQLRRQTTQPIEKDAAT